MGKPVPFASLIASVTWTHPITPVVTPMMGVSRTGGGFGTMQRRQGDVLGTMMQTYP